MRVNLGIRPGDDEDDTFAEVVTPAGLDALGDVEYVYTYEDRDAGVVDVHRVGETYYVVPVAGEGA